MGITSCIPYPLLPSSANRQSSRPVVAHPYLNSFLNLHASMTRAIVKRQIRELNFLYSYIGECRSRGRDKEIGAPQTVCSFSLALFLAGVISFNSIK